MFFKNVKEIDIHELKKRNKKKILLIDVQSREDFIYKHIPNSVNVDKKTLKKNPSDYILEPAYIVCNTGNKSKAVVRKLQSKGFDVTWVKGGVSAFGHHYPTVSRTIVETESQE